MAVGDVIRKAYERRPYPATDRRVVSGRFRHLPPLSWIQALGRPGALEPRRVLVAGCGTGAEAFELRRALPRAEIVAIDFSPRSIAIAERLQRSARLPRPIRFLVADLNDAKLARRIGGDFDVITCHGVLSYLTDPGRALRHLGACASPDAALYLGVNGAGHPGALLRRWLAKFGLDVKVMQDERRLRALLRVWDALQLESWPAFAGLPATYLAGDICGPHFNNWSLARWRNVAARGGWRIVSSLDVPQQLRRILPDQTYESLFPARTEELMAALDGAEPASFHRLLLRRNGADFSWDGTRAVLPSEWRWSGLYTVKMQPRRRGQPVWITLRSGPLNLKLEWPLSEQEAVAALALARAPVQAGRWPAGWPRTLAARRTLWLWAGFGVITVG